MILIYYTFKIQDVNRHHTGIYTCTADNDVGQPAAADIDLKVLCKSLSQK